MVILGGLLALVWPQEPASAAPNAVAPAAREAEFVAIEPVLVPDEIVLEVGGLVEWRGDWYAATRRGEIWRLQGGSGEQGHWSQWADGLQEPLGLLVHEDWLYCCQRGELSRMRDRNDDGRMDELQTVAQGWPLSGNYHEYCFGPVRDHAGRFWLTLNKPFGAEPFGRAPFRGWALRIDGSTGAYAAVCAGLRSPAGLGTSPTGQIWYSDNQGEWCATSKFALLEPGDFHGHPWGIASCTLPESRVTHPGEVKSGLRMAEAARTIPHFKLPAVWIPYDLCGRSPGGFVWDERGNFPPFQGQVFCGDQYSSEVFRLSLELVDGHFQGACYPFRRGLSCGIVRVAWGSDGALWCGLTNRGWGSKGPRAQGLERLVWRGQVPFELAEVRVERTGFALRFTLPVATALPSGAVSVRSWTYDHHEAYGCPPRDEQAHAVRGLELSADGCTLHVRLDECANCRVYELKCEAVRSRAGELPPVHGLAWYTRNRNPH